tara:strand:+ start:142 stop:459 length:318 start_codon:yes stop_codon:yes gene_type:complete
MKKIPDYRRRIKYSSNKTWKQRRPNERLINCPVIYNADGKPESAVNDLMAAVFNTGLKLEGYKYFAATCQEHPGKKCGSFWTEVTGVNRNYIYREGKRLKHQEYK